MSLEGELEWEPLDPSAVESAEAREYRERETQQVINNAGARQKTRRNDDEAAISKRLNMPGAQLIWDGLDRRDERNVPL